MRMFQGVYGPNARQRANECFWESRLRFEKHEQILNQIKRAPAHTPGSRMVGTVYLSSEFDKFTLSNNIQVRQPKLREWHVDLVIHNLLRKHERRVLRATRELNEYDSRHMTVRIPKQAMERIRRVVYTYFVNGPESEHVCQQAHMRERQWKLGSFKGANQLYTANMERIPDTTLSFEDSQRLIEWKRTRPDTALP